MRDRETISKELLMNGWKQEDVEEGFGVLSNMTIPSNIPNNFIQSKRTSNIKVFFIVLIIFLLAGGVLAYFFRSELMNMFVVKNPLPSPVVEVSKTPKAKIPDTVESCSPKTTEVLSQDKLEKWLTFYYVNPQPELTVQVINSFVATKGFDESNLRRPYAAFFTEIFRQNPDKLDGWIMKDLCGLNEYDTHTWDILTSALRMSDTSEGKQVLQKIREKSTSPGKEYIDSLLNAVVNSSNDIRTMKISSANGLDTMWTGFFASGDKRYIEQIMTVLDYMNTSKYKNISKGSEEYLLASTAEWSLESNAGQHVKVMDILKEKAKNTTDSWMKTELEKIISNAKNYKQ